MKTKILGTAFTLTSDIKTTTIVKLQKFSPESLKMKDAEKKNVVYAIGMGPAAAINQYGVTFNGTNADGFAQATIEIPASEENKLLYVKENYGLAMLGLSDMETYVATELTVLDSKFNTVEDSIELVD